MALPDYVIRSLNADKPYDQFLLEQIAGTNYSTTSRKSSPPNGATIWWPPDFCGPRATIPMKLVTTFVPNRMAVLVDQVNIFSSAVMGLTMQCARCLSHKLRSPSPARLLSIPGDLPDRLRSLRLVYSQYRAISARFQSGYPPTPPALPALCSPTGEPGSRSPQRSHPGRDRALGAVLGAKGQAAAGKARCGEAGTPTRGGEAGPAEGARNARRETERPKRSIW